MVKLEGVAYEEPYHEKYHFNGIENRVIGVYVQLVTAFIYMNPLTPHSENIQPRIHQHVLTTFLPFCHFYATFPKDKNLGQIFREILTEEDCKKYFQDMPGKEILKNNGEAYTDFWIEKHSDYILGNAEKFSEVLRKIIFKFKEFIVCNMPEISDHVALNEALEQVFSIKHEFKPGSDHTDFMKKVFLLDLRNECWASNINKINTYALSKGLSVIYIVGHSHLEGLKAILGERHGEFLINYYSDCNPKALPFRFTDDSHIGTTSVKQDEDEDEDEEFNNFLGYLGPHF